MEGQCGAWPVRCLASDGLKCASAQPSRGMRDGPSLCPTVPGPPFHQAPRLHSAVSSATTMATGARPPDKILPPPRLPLWPRSSNKPTSTTNKYTTNKPPSPPTRTTSLRAILIFLRVPRSTVSRPSTPSFPLPSTAHRRICCPPLNLSVHRIILCPPR